MSKDDVEIIVSLKDLSAAGFATLSGRLKAVDQKVDESGKHVGGFSSIIQGIGQGIGQAGLGFLEKGIDMVTDVLKDADKAYREAQASIAMLDTALRDNVPNWDGNTAAIEKSVDAGVKWGFSGESVRDSIAKLVGITHDVGKAQADLALAEDLARAKHIDLATATDIVTKAAQGNGKALKGLGIDITGAKTATEMLAAIQKNTAGAASDYMTTSAGKQAAAQEKVQEAMEKVGSVTDKITSAVMPLFADAVSGVVDALSPLIDDLNPMIDQVGKQLPGAIQNVVAWFKELPAPIQAFINPIATIAAHFDEIKSAFSGAGDSSSDLGGKIKELGAGFKKIFTDIQVIVAGATKIIMGLWHTFGGDITKYVQSVWTLVQSYFSGFFKTVQGIFDIFAGIFSGDWGKVWTGVKEVFSGIIDMIKAIFVYAITGVIPATISVGGKIIGAAFDLVWGLIRTGVKAAWDGIIGIIRTAMGLPGTIISAAFDAVVGYFSQLPTRISTVARGLFDGIGAAFKAALNVIVRAWNSLHFTLPSISAFGVTVGGGSFGVPALPYFHSGGVVPGQPGTNVPIMAQAGERVLSRSDLANQGGSGGQTHLHFHFNLAFMPTAAQARQLADAIEPELGRRLGRSSTSIGYGFGGN